jgi:hypothetical protein
MMGEASEKCTSRAPGGGGLLPLDVIPLLLEWSVHQELDRRWALVASHKKFPEITRDRGVLGVGDMVPLPLDEREQLGVNLILMCGGDAVRRAGIVDVPGVLDELG